MPSVTLPALVEAVIGEMVPAGLKKTDAAFIAAFQDCVIDYCRNYPADAASFVDWWKTKGSRLSINSPEGADAVRVMTIHKSKGLEFPIVFLCGLSRRLNREDVSRPILFDPKLGVGPKRLDLERGIEYPTLARMAVARKMERGMMAEEMRLLLSGADAKKMRKLIGSRFKKVICES